MYVAAFTIRHVIATHTQYSYIRTCFKNSSKWCCPLSSLPYMSDIDLVSILAETYVIVMYIHIYIYIYYMLFTLYMHMYKDRSCNSFSHVGLGVSLLGAWDDGLGPGHEKAAKKRAAALGGCWAVAWRAFNSNHHLLRDVYIHIYIYIYMYVYIYIYI